MNSRSDPITKSGETIGVLTTGDFIEKLKRSLRRDGDFPTSARVVAELRVIVSKPNTTANQITEIILREPSLGTRVLALVNSSFYRRAKPIMTISQAVIQIGMKPLADLCAGLILLQRFVPAAREGGAFAECLRQSLITSLLTSSICSTSSERGSNGNGETGYLAGTFYELGGLLLAFYFPKVYENARKRMKDRTISLELSIKQLTGLSPLEISLEIMEELKLPEFYKQVLELARVGVKYEVSQKEEAKRVAQALRGAGILSSIIGENGDKDQLEIAVSQIQDQYEDPIVIRKALASLPELFRQRCGWLDLNLPALPAYLKTFDTSRSSEIKANSEPTEIIEAGAGFYDYVEEIKEAISSRESMASILTRTMETMAWSLKFDRVLLMLLNTGKRSLQGRMLLGNYPGFNPREFQRPAREGASAKACEANALMDGEPISDGEPTLPGANTFVAIPIGIAGRSVGVLYADRTSSGNSNFSNQEIEAFEILTDLLDKALAINGGSQ